MDLRLCLVYTKHQKMFVIPMVWQTRTPRSLVLPDHPSIWTCSEYACTKYRLPPSLLGPPGLLPHNNTRHNYVQKRAVEIYCSGHDNSFTAFECVSLFSFIIIPQLPQQPITWTTITCSLSYPLAPDAQEIGNQFRQLVWTRERCRFADNL